MRTTVTIDDQLLASARRSAQRAGQTLGEFVEESIRLRLAAKPRVEIPIVPVFEAGTGVLPGVDATSNRSLYDVLDDSGDRT